METWELWYPAAAATGLLVARSRIDPVTSVWTHSPPDLLTVLVRDADEKLIAHTENLAPEGKHFPMARLERDGASIRREDRWPLPGDIGAVVILPGGEAGVLKSWWNADDETESRWDLEFYNHT
jgi:hypothetical protein